jgi:hypothetical protein
MKGNIEQAALSKCAWYLVANPLLTIQSKGGFRGGAEGAAAPPYFGEVFLA